MSQAHPPLLAVDRLVKHYRLRTAAGSSQQIRAVDDISIQLFAGETLAIVGESGCGKSTLARLIMQLEQPDSGAVSLEGRQVGIGGRTERHAFRRAVQMVFQDPFGSLTPHFRVGTLVGEPLLVHRLASGVELRRRVAALLDSVGLESSLSNRFPHELSGGQRQRVSIARAIATRPRVVVCDEPVSALDVSVRSQIINLLLHLQRDLGLSYLFISHDLGLVDHISDHVCVMYLGRIVEQAPTAQFFAAPRHPYSRALIASTPKPEPGRRDRVSAVVGEVGLDEPATGCRFRNRCPMAIGVCGEHDPVLAPVAPGHLAACHRASEFDADRPGPYRPLGDPDDNA